MLLDMYSALPDSPMANCANTYYYYTVFFVLENDINMYNNSSLKQLLKAVMFLTLQKKKLHWLRSLSENYSITSWTIQMLLAIVVQALRPLGKGY